MSDRIPSLQEALVASFESQMNNVFTAIPCIVVAIRNNLEGQEVDIQPSINQRLKDGTVKERPPILGVPVSFQVSRTAGFTFPINVGDTGLAVFSMRNLDAWKASTGRPSTPLNFAKMDKGDAVFIPGIQPPSVAVNDPQKRFWPHSTLDAVLVNNIGTSQENEVRLKASGDVIINTQQNVEVNCNNATVTAQADITMTCANFSLDASTSITVTSPTTTWIGDINQTGNYNITGTYILTGTSTFNGIAFDTHDHIPGPGPSNP